MELHFVLLLVAVLLIVVSLVERLAVRLALSASVLLAVIGLAIGATAAAVAYVAPSSAIGGVAGRVFDLQIGSEAFLYIFLPILVFQGALEIEVREMAGDAAPILLLAVIAVVVATLVIGVALAPIAGVSLVACWMLGAIVATTDPVAVIAIFRDVGAPSRLTRLVEGESLLNDAAAIALFAVLLEIVIGGHGAGFGGVAWSFVRAFVGGVVVGALGARAVIGLLSWLPDLRLAQVTLTLALPYLVFILSERTFGVSGVVAIPPSRRRSIARPACDRRRTSKPSRVAGKSGRSRVRSERHFPKKYWSNQSTLCCMTARLDFGLDGPCPTPSKPR